MHVCSPLGAHDVLSLPALLVFAHVRDDLLLTTSFEFFFWQHSYDFGGTVMPEFLKWMEVSGRTYALTHARTRTHAHVRTRMHMRTCAHTLGYHVCCTERHRRATAFE